MRRATEGVCLTIACGQLVQNLRMKRSKKCVHPSPVGRAEGTHRSLAWITIAFYPQAYTRSLTGISTAKVHAFASVWPPIFPTFHSTYNNHHQFI